MAASVSHCRDGQGNLLRYLYPTNHAKEDPPGSLRLPDEVSQRLQRMADLTGRSKTFYMIQAIREHLDDLEDQYLAEQRLIALRSGQSRTVSLEEVMQRYGLED